jgi:hypothetical protein
VHRGGLGFFLALAAASPATAQITYTAVPDSVALGEVITFAASEGTDATIYGANTDYCGSAWHCGFNAPKLPDTDGPSAASMRMVWGSTRWQYATAQLSTTTRPYSYISATECWPNTAITLSVLLPAPRFTDAEIVEFGVIDGCREISGHVYDRDGNPIPDFLLLLSAIEEAGGDFGLYGDGFNDVGLATGFHVVKTDADGFWSAVLPNVAGDYFGDPAYPFTGYRVIPLQSSPFRDGVRNLGAFYPFDHKSDLNDPAQLVDRDFYLLPEVTGHVLDLKGRPIQGITLYGIEVGSNIVRGSAGTDENGAYRMWLPEGTYNITPSMPEPDIIEPATRTVDVLVGGVDPIADFTYVAYRLSGYVRDDSQTGVADVDVTVHRPVDDSFHYTYTNDDGYYEITLKRGVYTVAPVDPDEDDGVPVTPESRVVSLDSDDGSADFQVGSNAPPIADFTYDIDPNDDRHYTFDASASSDNDPIPFDGYRWLIDGNLLEGQIVEYTFPDDGEFGVGLVVTDEDGAVGEKSITIDVGVRLTATLVFSTDSPRIEQNLDLLLAVKNEDDEATVADVVPRLVSIEPEANVVTFPPFVPESVASLDPGEETTFRFRVQLLDDVAHTFYVDASGTVGGRTKTTPTVLRTVTASPFDATFRTSRAELPGRPAVESAPDDAVTGVDEIMRSVRMTDSIVFEGEGWDPDGPPVVVRLLNGPQIGAYPPDANGAFEGEFELGQLRRSKKGEVGTFAVCDQLVFAEQGDLRRRVMLLGRPVEQVIVAANVRDSRDVPLETDDLLCEGELAFAGPSQTLPLIGGEEFDSSYVPADDPTHVCNIAPGPLTYLTVPFYILGGGEERGRGTELGSDAVYYGGFWWQNRRASGTCSDVQGIHATFVFIDGRLVSRGTRNGSTRAAMIGEGVSGRPLEPDKYGPNSLIARYVVLKTGAPYPDDDSDYDRIRNAIDGVRQGGAYQDRSNEFSDEFALDGTGTGGKILERGTQTVSADLAPSGDKIALSSESTASADSPEDATLDLCGFATSVNGGDAANFACGSLILEVLSGPIEVRLGGDAVTSVPSGVTATIRRIGDEEYEVTHIGGAGLAIVITMADGENIEVAPTETRSIFSRPDSDLDGAADEDDACPSDFNKTEPGLCGCGGVDADSDGDGTLDCDEDCPFDFSKLAPGACGCGEDEADSDTDGTPDCIDACPVDMGKTEPGACGCGIADADGDGDLTADCIDGCPQDSGKAMPGACGCGNADTDADGDGVPGCVDNCPSVANADQLDSNGNGVGNACEVPAPAERTLCASLSGFLDVDRYVLDATKNEHVAVTLRADPPRATQKYALLGLDDSIPGVTFVRADTGKVPNAVQGMLPKTGRYVVTVASFGPSSLAFKGNYCVAVHSSGQAAASLRPHLAANRE